MQPLIVTIARALPAAAACAHDRDVFAIDAMASPPRQVSGPGGSFQGVGTILFGMAVNPVSGKVYVSNTDANNLDRFEGPGTFTGHSLRGHLHESRITVLAPDGGVAPRHLNKHIDYGSCCAPIPNAENARSLAFPQGMAVTGDGATLYVAALGSDKIGVFSTAQLERDTFVPSAAIVDTAARAEAAHVRLHDPEPPRVVAGRRFLYDAALSSSHGDSACASCHVFGDFDSLAWDLGNPDGGVTAIPGPFASGLINVITRQPIDRRARPAVSDAALRLLAARGSPVTYTCAPPGSGERIGVDRDGDGAWDGDERDAGTEPADPASRP